MGIPVSVMKMIVTKAEFNGWIKYFNQKPADIQEVQLAVISALVSGAAGGKGKVEDFILSNKNSKKQKGENKLTEDAVKSVFRGLI